MFYLLQGGNLAKTGTDTLLQYGILGLFAVLMIYVIYYQNKKRERNEDLMRAEMQELKTEMKHNQDEHEKFIREEYRRSVGINEKCIEVLDEVKELLIQKKI